MTSNKILILCKNCKAKNRLDTSLKDKVVRCGKCGEPLALDISESMAPAIATLRETAGKIKMEFEDYSHYKVCSIAVDLVEDTIHIKWKVETDIEELWRLKQRWMVSYHFTLKMIIEVVKRSQDHFNTFAISFFERYLNFSPEDEGDNFRDLCLLSIKGDRKQITELGKRLKEKNYLSLTGPERQEEMESLQKFTRNTLMVKQNYKGTLVNKSSLIYKAVKPFDLVQDREEKELLQDDISKKSLGEIPDVKDDKKLTAMKLIEANISLMNRLDTPYLRIFARKYGLGNKERRTNLQELLISKNIRLPEKVIYRLIQKELDEIEFDRFTKKIETEEKLPLNHYIRRYLELVPDIEDQNENFYRFLVERKIIIEDVSMNSQTLKKLITKVHKSIDIEQFEKKLFEDYEPTSTQPGEEKKQDLDDVTPANVDPSSESYQFFSSTLSPGKPGGIPGIIRLYIDNFMDNSTNRAMLLYLFYNDNLVSDPTQINISDEIKKIQYEDIPEAIEEEEMESFDSYSSTEIIEHLSKFNFRKRLHLTRYLFQRMGFNARIVDKEEGRNGIIFLDNKEDEKLIVKYFHIDGAIDKTSISSIKNLVQSYHADYGIAVCKDNFEAEAIQFALENDIELIDTDKVRRLIMNIF